ncbi:MAG: hypothetical protein AAFN94_03480 [Pseudomonadota bacterium]
MATFYRWVPREHAEAAFELGLVSHNGSATWIFSMDVGNFYRPSVSITKDAWLLAFEVSDNATTNLTTHNLIKSTADDYEGENQHPWKNIVKDNEIGAIGIGRHRQKTTNWHTETRWATKKEVAKALGISELSVDVGYRPGRTWPK